MIDKFAPTPQHGAAYAVVIEKVGGMHAIGACDTEGVFAIHKETLDRIMTWTNQQEDPLIKRAYHWAINKVKTDLRNRLDVFENSRRVAAAMANLPKP